MARQKKNSLKKISISIADLPLPQNILLIGESDQSEKKVYILQKTYNDIHRFTKDKIKNESGGILVGKEISEFGKSNILIAGFIEAKHCEATPTTLKFTHKSWEYIHSELEKNYPDGKIVGWIHTHPDFGIFLSQYDKFIQENFFADENQVAYVIDPIQKAEGFYVWVNGKIEKCAGFFLFDEIGKKIDFQQSIEENSVKTPESTVQQKSLPQLLFSVAVILLIIVLGFMCLKLNDNVDVLQSQIRSLSQQNQELRQDVLTISNELQNLRNEITSTLSETTPADVSAFEEEPEQPPTSNDIGGEATLPVDGYETNEQTITGGSS